VIKKILAIPLMLSLLTGMSMVPDEQRELNVIELDYVVPFSRADKLNTPMTWDEYAGVNIYVNGELYPYALPSVDIMDTNTTHKQHVIYVFDEEFDVNLTLVDTEGRESAYSKTLNFNYTGPQAPAITCQ